MGTKRLNTRDRQPLNLPAQHPEHFDRLRLDARVVGVRLDAGDAE
jgi:hypothetical protein